MLTSEVFTIYQLLMVMLSSNAVSKGSISILWQPHSRILYRSASTTNCCCMFFHELQMLLTWRKQTRSSSRQGCCIEWTSWQTLGIRCWLHKDNFLICLPQNTAVHRATNSFNFFYMHQYGHFTLIILLWLQHGPPKVNSVTSGCLYCWSIG